MEEEKVNLAVGGTTPFHSSSLTLPSPTASIMVPKSVKSMRYTSAAQGTNSISYTSVYLYL